MNVICELFCAKLSLLFDFLCMCDGLIEVAERLNKFNNLYKVLKVESVKMFVNL